MYRLLSLLVMMISMIERSDATPLDDYVNKPDPIFSWKLIRTYPSSTYTVYVLNMTSQTWFDGRFSMIEMKIPFVFSSRIFKSTSLVALYDHHRAGYDRVPSE